jgi:hypothetical protein
VTSAGTDGIAAWLEDGATVEGRFTVTGNLISGSKNHGFSVSGPTAIVGTVDGNTIRSSGIANINVPAAYARVKVGVNATG